MCRFCSSGKPLAYCHDESIGAVGADMKVDLDEGAKIIVWTDVFGNWLQSKIDISYCPKCGRRLLGAGK